MSLVLVVGCVPPNLQKHKKIEAAHIRTWQFVESLAGDGHEVCLCVPGVGGTERSIESPKNLTIVRVPFESMGWVRRFQSIHDDFDPHCIVTASGLLPALYATKLRTSKPLWMDMYGDPLTIYQIAHFRARSDRGHWSGIHLMKEALRRGDIFSVCGLPQQHLLVGELALAGRLNWRTTGYEFCRIVHPAAGPAIGNHRDQYTLMREMGIKADDFVILWAGGYNTWTDVHTLCKGLELAMDKDVRIHFISVGGASYEATETIYDEFVKLVEASRHASRFHLCGWRTRDELMNIYSYSHAGVSIDAANYETVYGTRTRLVEMMANGLPIVTSKGCELSDMIERNGAGLVFSIGDPDGLADCLLKLASDKRAYTTMQDSSHTLAAEELSLEKTTTPLRTWVRSPVRAPDSSPLQFRESVEMKVNILRSLVRKALWQFGFSGNRLP